MEGCGEFMRAFLQIRKVFLKRVIALLIVVICLWVLYGQIGQHILRPITKNRLERVCGSGVEIGDMDFELSGYVRIRNLAVGPPREGDFDNKILKAREVRTWFSPLSVLLFKPEIKRIVLDDFVFNVQYDSDSDSLNIMDLDFDAGKSGQSSVPVIRAESGIMKYSVVRGGRVDDVIVAGISGSIGPGVGDREIFGFNFLADERLSFGGSELRGVWQSGERGRVRLHDSKIITYGSPVMGNMWSLTKLEGEIEYDRDKIVLEKLSFEVGDKTRASFSGSIKDYLKEANYELSIEAENILLSGETERDALVYSDSALSLLSEDLRSFLEQFRPRGRGNVNVVSEGKLSDLAKSKWNGTIDCWDVFMRDREFPYLVEYLHGRLEVSEKGSVFDRLEARHGDVELVISGHAFGGGDDLDSEMRVHSDNMRLDEDLYNAMNTNEKKLWFTFAPEGRAEIDYFMSIKPGKEKEERLDVRLDGVDSVYQHFPYPMEDVTGRVEVRDSKIILEDVVSSYDHPEEDYLITLNGYVEEIDSVEPKFHIVIDANNVPIDDKLKMALPPNQRNFYDLFEMNIRTDARIKVFPNEVGKRLVEYIAWAKVRGAELTYGPLPVPLSDVSVDAILTPDLVRIEDLSGIGAGGQVRLSGKVWPENEFNEETYYCLRIDARRVELTDDLLYAVPGGQNSEFLDDIETSGEVDVSAVLNKGAKDPCCPAYHIDIDCLGNSLVYKKLPFKIEDVRGQIRMSEGMIELKDLKSVVGRLSSTVKNVGTGEFKGGGPGSGEGKVSLDGIVYTEDKKLVRADFAVETENVYFDENFGNELQGELGDFYKKVSPAGFLDVSVPRASIYERHGRKTIEFSCRAEVSDCSLGQSKIIDSLDAVLEVQNGRYIFDEGFDSAEGLLNASRFNIKGREVENLRAAISYEPVSGEFRSDSFKAECYGGKVLGDAVIRRLSGGGIDYQVHTVFGDVGMQGVLSADEDYRGYTEGTLSGDVSVLGSTEGEKRNLGRVNLSINDLKFNEVTLAGKVLEAAHKDNEPPEFKFSDITVESYLKGDEIYLQDILIYGESTVLRGAGTVGLDGNEIDVNLRTFSRDVYEEPSFFESLSIGLSPAFVKITVSGKLDEPDIEAEPLPVIKGPLQLLGPEQ
jgi:hypothetical protein